VVEGQVRAALRGLEVPAVAPRLVIAYEPVWAIGTGRNADPGHAGATMELVKRVVRERGAEVRVLYGGSVKAANVRPYLELAACDGCLVGGASLDASEFSNLIAIAAEVAG
ncbi:MAG: triose-phosphate isomerase, partial [Candidatus Dormibacteraeota bacterium]|nr:triose-phosphate isomerase [Candidatus Dormibacteraeota bacterium]